MQINNWRRDNRARNRWRRNNKFPYRKRFKFKRRIWRRWRRWKIKIWKTRYFKLLFQKHFSVSRKKVKVRKYINAGKKKSKHIKPLKKKFFNKKKYNLIKNNKGPKNKVQKTIPNSKKWSKNKFKGTARKKNWFQKKRSKRVFFNFFYLWREVRKSKLRKRKKDYFKKYKKKYVKIKKNKYKTIKWRSRFWWIVSIDKFYQNYKSPREKWKQMKTLIVSRWQYVNTSNNFDPRRPWFKKLNRWKKIKWFKKKKKWKWHRYLKYNSVDFKKIIRIRKFYLLTIALKHYLNIERWHNCTKLNSTHIGMVLKSLKFSKTDRWIRSLLINKKISVNFKKVSRKYTIKKFDLIFFDFSKIALKMSTIFKRLNYFFKVKRKNGNKFFFNNYLYHSQLKLLINYKNKSLNNNTDVFLNNFYKTYLYV